MPLTGRVCSGAAAEGFRLLLVGSVVGHIPVLTLLELHMVLGLTHILKNFITFACVFKI